MVETSSTRSPYWDDSDNQWSDPNQMISLIILAVEAVCVLAVVIGGIVWLYWKWQKRQNQRRLNMRELPLGRTGDIKTSLCDCCCRPDVCLPATFCTSCMVVLNRAEVDGRTPSLCDLVCVPNQFHVRQSIRAKYGLINGNCDLFKDALETGCCHPCATGRDFLELESRGDSDVRGLTSHPFSPFFRSSAPGNGFSYAAVANVGSNGYASLPLEPRALEMVVAPSAPPSYDPIQPPLAQPSAYIPYPVLHGSPHHGPIPAAPVPNVNGNALSEEAHIRIAIERSMREM